MFSEVEARGNYTQKFPRVLAYINYPNPTDRY